MKFLRLDLLAYGPFSGESLDFSAANGLQIVYGPNEAGKSTTLRALRAVLFGIEARTADDHVHKYNDLRIGARLHLSGDEPIGVVRRKGNKNTLRDAADADPIDDRLISLALGAIDEAAFKTRFGINHDALVQGGREIAEGRGDVGELLFAASAGIAHLSNLQSRLADDAEMLYKQRGQNPAINAALAEYADAARELRSIQLSAEDWARRQRELDDARADLDRLEREFADATAAQKKLARYEAALPLASRRAALVDDLASAGDVPSLPEDFPRRWREAAEQVRLARHAQERAQQELARIDARLAELGPLPAILAHAPAVEAICGELSRHVKAAQDGVGLAADEAQFAAQVERLIDRVGRPSDGGERCFVVRTADRARIEELGARFHELSARRESAERRRTQIERRAAEASAELASCPAAADGDAARRLVTRLSPLVEAETQHAAAAERLAAEEQQLTIDAARLPRWGRDLAALERLPAPAEEAVRRFDEELAAAAAAVDRAAHRRDEAEDDRRRVEQKLAECQAASDVPSAEDLISARNERNAAWQALRGALAAGDLPAAAERAERCEPLFAAADAIADRMRRDAEAVAERAALQGELVRKTAAATAAESQWNEALGRNREIAARWAELWRPCGVEPLAPREMLAWLAERRRLCEAAAALRTRRAEQVAVVRRLEDARREAFATAAALGAAVPCEASLAQAADALDEALGRIERQRLQRQALESAIAVAARELAEVDDDLLHTNAQLKEWRSAWAAAVAPIGHDDRLTPRQAQALLGQLAEIQNLIDKRQGCAERIAGINRDLEGYVARLAEVASRVGGDFDLRRVSRENLGDVEMLAGDLARRLAAAREAATERRKLAADRDRQAAELNATRDDAGASAAALDELCREARAASAEELPAIEERWRRQADLRRQLCDLDERLHGHAGGAPVAEFLAELSAVDADGLAGERARLEARLSELAAERDPLRERIWSLERGIATTLGRDDAAAANAQLQSLRAQLQVDVAQYARLRLASAVLRRAIDRYRQKNEAPLLRRASDIFARLTCGAFAELKTDFADDKPVLVAVRTESGKSVGVTGMSDGTCDQLYLALRLSSVEHYLDNHPPIPFIVDDVLQRFDDRRAAAALAAFAELAKKTQVIFFTHHRHVLDLAAEHLPTGDYCSHFLGAGERDEPPRRERKRSTSNTPAPTLLPG